jgi:hypothetical protein
MDGSPDLVCNDLPQLVRALDGLGACVADAPAGTRPRCAPVAGTGHARALVERVLRLYGHPGILACRR